MTEHRTGDRALRHSADAARQAARALMSSDVNADHTDFTAAGDHLSEMTRSLYTMTSYLALAIPHYGDTRILRDGNGANPKRHLGDALIRLHEARAAFIDAGKALTTYQIAIEQLTVTADHNGLRGRARNRREINRLYGTGLRASPRWGDTGRTS